DETVGDPGLPAPPLPGLPPAAAAPVAAPGPRPRLRSAKLAKMFDESESLELEADDLIETLDADDAAAAEPAPHVRPHRMTSPPIVAAQETARPAAISAGDAIAQLGSLTERNKIIEVLLGYASGIFPVTLLFNVRDQLAF